MIVGWKGHGEITERERGGGGGESLSERETERHSFANTLPFCSNAQRRRWLSCVCVCVCVRVCVCVCVREREDGVLSHPLADLVSCLCDTLVWFYLTLELPVNSTSEHRHTHPLHAHIHALIAHTRTRARSRAHACVRVHAHTHLLIQIHTRACTNAHTLPPHVDRLVGLVVKASASRAEDPGFESRLRRDFFGVESYQ